MQPIDQAPQSLQTEKQTEITEITKPKSLGDAMSQIRTLENDLLYATGKGDKVDIKARIEELKLGMKIGPEFKMLDEENKKNFESGMSFNNAQKRVLNDFWEFAKTEYGSAQLNKLKFTTISQDEDGDNDIQTKNYFDEFVKSYRAKRNLFSESGYDSDYSVLDKFVLDYEKAFGLPSAPLIDAELKKQRDLETNKRELNNLVVYLKSLEQRLLEEKAVAKRGIFGGIDTSKTANTEVEIVSVKRCIAMFMSEIARQYLGIYISVNDMGA